jgi:hypothetical protein
MSYYWTTAPELPEAAQERFGLDAGFEDQGAAEAWLSDNFTDLFQAGAGSVALWDDSRLIYDMSLSE